MKKFPLLLLLLSFFTFTQNLMAQDNAIIYFGDPMCSWCYGFSDEVTELKSALPELDFTLVLGGLRPNGTEKITSLADFLKEHWEEIAEISGKKFSYDILIYAAAKSVGISKEEFSEAFNDNEIINETINDFIYAQNLGVTGFPTIVLKKGEDLYLISSGYKKAEDLVALIKKTLAEN